MSVEPQRRPIDKQIKTDSLHPAVPTGFYVGPDFHQYAEEAGQNRSSVINHITNAESAAEQIDTESMPEGPLLMDERMKIRSLQLVMMQTARVMCLDPDIDNSTAWEYMKLLLQMQFPKLPLAQEFDSTDFSKDARMVALLESYFNRRRPYSLSTPATKSEMNNIRNKYAVAVRNLETTYYREVWKPSQQYLNSIRLHLPNPTQISRTRRR
jgi:hypothetical protein